MLLERGLHDAALNATAASVHEPHVLQSRVRRRVHVFLDDRRNVPRRERVEVQLRFDGKSNRVVLHAAYCLLPTVYCLLPTVYLTYSAVTVVFIPPRTEKSPTTVMRRGLMAETRSSRI